MKILWIIILVDCLLTILFVGLLDVPEINPLMSWMIPYVGLGGMIVAKLIYTYLLLNVLAKPMAIKHKVNYNKTCHICAVIYVAALIAFY
jgi:hypothetical protein